MSKYTKSQYVESLKYFVKFFAENKYKWFLGSSGALMVHGVKVNPSDLDIIVKNEDIEQIYKHMQKHTNSEIEDHDSVKKFSVSAGVVPSEIVAFKKFASDLISVHWEGLVIPVNTLEKELSYYLDRKGKEEKVELIRERLKEM
jgi:hypothetical protein